jgi:hypothetical protein
MKTKIRFSKCIMVLILLSASVPILAQLNQNLSQVVCIGTQSYSVDLPSGIAGSTYAWTLSGGGVISSGNGTYSVTVNWTTPGGPYTLSVIRNDGTCDGPPQSVSVTVNASPSAGLTSSATANTICAGESVTFTATGGPTYEFFVNGVSQGAAGATSTFTTSSLTNGQTVTCKVTNAGDCSAISPGITMTVNDLPTAGLSSNAPGNTICAGASVTFTATGGTLYEFFINAVSQGAASATSAFTTSALTNGQVVTVKVTNASGCSSISSGITMTVNALPTAGLTSNAVGNTICAGGSVTFTATGGTLYEFFVDGVSQGPESATSTFTTTTLTNAQTVTVKVKNASGCSATSTGIITTVKALPLTSPIWHN